MKALEKENIVQDFSEKRATYFAANYGTALPGNYLRRLRRQLIIEAVGTRASGAAVLDAGCGPAILYPSILDQAARYVALDLTPANLEEIAKSHPSAKVECTVGDLDTYSWTPHAYDIVICSGAIEYTIDPDLVLSHMARAVRPGGLLVCSFPNVTSPYRLWSQYFYTPLVRIMRRATGKGSLYYRRRLFSSAKTVSLLQRTFASVEVTFFGHKPLLQPLDAFFPAWDSRASEKLQNCAGRLLARTATEYLVKCS